MKIINKILIFYLLFAFHNSHSYILGSYDPAGYNFLTQILSIKNKPEMLLNAPPNLLNNLIDYFLPGTNISGIGQESLKELFYDKDIEFYTYIWGQVLDLSKKPKNRQYNVAFHHDAQRWLNKPQGDFQLDTPMGIFEANGIKEIKSDTAETSKPISFNKLSPRSINMHDGTTALSPNNAQFELEENRNIATFWSMALSPDKTHGIVVFNIFVDEDNTQQDFNKLIIGLHKTNDFNDLINGVKGIASNISKINPNDANALNNAANTLLNLIKPIEKIELLFHDRNFNDQFFLFPITFPITFINYSDQTPYKVFQFRVLSQYLNDACLYNSITGNTCGRHALKNSIFGMLALDNYAKNKNEFEKGANNLTELNQESICIFQKIDEELKKNRQKTGISPSEQTLSKEEFQHLINIIDQITTSCSIATQNKDQFSVISDILTVVSQVKTGATEIDEEFIKEIEKFRTSTNYQHAFNIGAGKKPGEHWFTIIVIKMPGIILFIPLESANNTDRVNSPFTKELIKILLDTSYANPQQLRSEIFLNKLLPAVKNSYDKIEKILNDLFLNRIENKDLNTLSNTEKQTNIKKIFLNINELTKDYIDSINGLENMPVAEKSKLQKELLNIENFLTQDFSKTLQTFSLFQEIENFDQVTKELTKIIQEFLKTRDNKKFDSNFENLLKNIKLTISKYLQKYLNEFPNIMNDINQQDSEGKNLLRVASENRDNEAVKTALDLGANPKISASDGATVLHVTAEHNLLEPMKLILAKHPDVVDYQGNRGATPLRIAVESGRSEAAKILLDSGANSNIKGSDGLSAADILKQGIGRSKTLPSNLQELILPSFNKILANYKSQFPNLEKNINEQNAEGKTLLRVAAENRDNNAMQAALDLNADPKISASDGATVLHVTAEHNLIEPMKLILAKHPDVVDYQGNRGATPLRIAVENARSEASKLLLDNKANPNTKGSDGLSAADILKQGIGRSSQLSQDVKKRLI